VNDIIINMQTDIDFEYWDAQIKHFAEVLKNDSSSTEDRDEATIHLVEIRTRLKRDIRDLDEFIKELESQL